MANLAELRQAIFLPSVQRKKKEHEILTINSCLGISLEHCFRIHHILKIDISFVNQTFVQEVELLYVTSLLQKKCAATSTLITLYPEPLLREALRKFFFFPRVTEACMKKVKDFIGYGEVKSGF